MVTCSRCGQEIGAAATCPSCGFSQGKGIIGRGVDKVAKTSGTVIEKSVKVTDEVVKEAKPVVKAVVETGKTGISKLKKKTLQFAKDLKE